MKEVVGEGALVFLIVILAALCFTGNGAISFRTQGTAYQTNITGQIQNSIVP